MKQRFSSLDVKVIAHELSNSLVTLRLGNVYDLSSKIFLFKFAKPDNKQQLVVDSGFRCHLTSFLRATAATPSDFVARLRKYLKTRRVTSISQVGTDRIIEFQFSDGQYRLFLEFYAGGNVILTDKELNILALLRVVSEGEGQEELRTGLKYSLVDRQNYGGIPPLTKKRVCDALQKAVSNESVPKAKKKGADALRKALAVSITEYPPMLIDHAMRVADFDAKLKPNEILQSDTLQDDLMQSLQEAQRVVEEITSSSTSTGFIIAKKNNTNLEHADDIDSPGNLLYEDFHPFRPRQFEDDPSCTFLAFDGFNRTVDEFFSSIEGQKLQSRLQEREVTARKKLEAARQDQANRLGGLHEVQELNIRKAAAIEANVERVSEALEAVNGLIAQGMDWVEIGKLIELEQKRNNPVASIIKLPLKLHENTITLLLGEADTAEDDESEYGTDSEVSDSEDEKSKITIKTVTDARLAVDVNLGESPWSNAREYYGQRRSAVVKEQKTLISSSIALKSAQQKIEHDLKKGLKQEKAVLRPVRQQFWFEKFTYFVSSDKYLVLGGRDTQQNEMLYKRYLRKGDVYVHADIQGATTIIIRNNSQTPDAPIPPSTLSQAGTMAIAASSAWDSKAGMSAWWVNADQVSKSAPGGEFLPVGKFAIRGQKNFLPPAVLLLGFAVMFQISEQSKVQHVKHRIPKDSPAELSDTGSRDVDDDYHDADVLSGNEHSDAGTVATNNLSDDDEDLEAKKMIFNPLQGEIHHQDSDVADDGGREDTLKSTIIPAVQSLNLDLTSASVLSTNNDQEDEDNGTDANARDSGDDNDVSEKQEHSGELSSPLEFPVDDSRGSKKLAAPLPRGKRSKAKKIATKYRDQDEEDRIAAQQVIGAAAGQEKAIAEAKAKEQHEAELAFQKERRRAQHQRTQKETAEYEQLRQAKLEAGEDVTIEHDNEVERLTPLDAFVGIPLPGDEIIEAIPICAPWSALAQYKYKVKLQPGMQKKGKAVKEILTRWVADAGGKGKVDAESRDVERMWPREVELLKGWKAEECINVVPVSKVRVMMAGGSAGQAAGKATQGKSRGGKGSKKR